MPIANFLSSQMKVKNAYAMQSHCFFDKCIYWTVEVIGIFHWQADERSRRSFPKRQIGDWVPGGRLPGSGKAEMHHPSPGHKKKAAILSDGSLAPATDVNFKISRRRAGLAGKLTT